jgi:hypothetical protein
MEASGRDVRRLVASSEGGSLVKCLQTVLPALYGDSSRGVCKPEVTGSIPVRSISKNLLSCSGYLALSRQS